MRKRCGLLQLDATSRCPLEYAVEMNNLINLELEGQL